MESYLFERYFRVKHNEGYSAKNRGWSPQGNVLGLTLYQLYTADLPQTENVETATFADDTAITVVHDEPNEATKLHKSLDEIGNWTQKWKIKINASKSTHIIFTTRHVANTQITINNETISTTNNVKYLRMHLNKRMAWKVHITAKRKQVDLKLRKMNSLFGYKSPLTLNNKMLLL